MIESKIIEILIKAGVGNAKKILIKVLPNRVNNTDNDG